METINDPAPENLYNPSSHAPLVVPIALFILLLILYCLLKLLFKKRLRKSSKNGKKKRDKSSSETKKTNQEKSSETKKTNQEKLPKWAKNKNGSSHKEPHKEPHKELIDGSSFKERKENKKTSSIDLTSETLKIEISVYSKNNSINMDYSHPSLKLGNYLLFSFFFNLFLINRLLSFKMQIQLLN